jgi:acyl-coenzyme A synthetase/AMP-(fatty) acid ligase
MMPKSILFNSNLAKVVYYKQLKGGVQFVDAIPKSPSGKILRRLLRDRVRKEKEEMNQNKTSKL